MKLSKLVTTAAVALAMMAGTASAKEMRIALVVKALGIGFFEAAHKAPRKPRRNWAMCR